MVNTNVIIINAGVYAGVLTEDTRRNVKVNHTDADVIEMSEMMN